MEALTASIEEFEAHSGWELDDRGACRGDVCIPLPDDAVTDGTVDIARLANRLEMPLVHDEKHDVWSLGPVSGGRALVSASAPRLVLPEIRGGTFDLRSLRGQKVLLVAWASW